MADYGAQDTSTTSLGVNQFPISETWTPNVGFAAVEGGPQTTDGGGKKSAPVSTYEKDGGNVALGATTDAAVTGDTAGSISAKQRGLVKILTDIWDSVNHRIHVNVDNVNANGQNTMVNSAPVVLPSDQVHAANAEGLVPSNLLAQAMYIASAGGPPDSTGKPQSAVWDHLASLQGKLLAGASTNITSTLAGDTALAFSAAPKTIIPGQKVQLSVGTGGPVETVIVANSYVISSTATSIPLQYPVVNAGSTTAKWDSYGPNGPAGGTITPLDIAAFALATQDSAGGGNNAIASNANSDNQARFKFLEIAAGLLNGAGNIDVQRGNLDVQLLASAARTTTQTPADIVNYNGRGIKVWLDMTVVGTGSVTLTINGKDPGSGKYILLLSGAAVIANITSVYTIYPSAPVAANVSVNDILPRTFQIIVTANNANSATYSVGYSIIV